MSALGHLAGVAVGSSHAGITPKSDMRSRVSYPAGRLCNLELENSQPAYLLAQECRGALRFGNLGAERSGFAGEPTLRIEVIVKNVGFGRNRKSSGIVGEFSC